MAYLNLISFCIGIVGIIVIAWGVVLVVIDFLHYEFIKILRVFQKKNSDALETHNLRQYLGSYILLGLEFMIAGDIIHTVLKPNKEALIVLGSIVAIRTVISFFLTKELNEYK